MWDSKNEKTGTPKLEPKNLPTNASWLGPSLLVKGEISGGEDFFIDGSVEGVVCLHEKKLTIGPTANVKADIIAGHVIVKGNVKGNVRAGYRIEIGSDGSVTGDLTTPQVFIEDGALFKGSIEIEKNAEKPTNQDVFSETKSAPKNLTAAAGATNV